MPLPKELKDKWEEAERTREPVDIGDIVICDICSKDYTNLPDNRGPNHFIHIKKWVKWAHSI